MAEDEKKDVAVVDADHEEVVLTVTGEKMVFELENPLTGEIVEYSGKPNDVWAMCDIMIRELYALKNKAIQGAENRALESKKNNPLLSNTFREESRFGTIKIQLKSDPRINESDLEWLKTYVPELVRVKTKYELNKKLANTMMSTKYEEGAEEKASKWLIKKHNEASIKATVSLEDK